MPRTPNDIMGARFARTAMTGQEQRAAAAADIPSVKQVYPPYLYKLPSSRDFNVNAFNGTLAAGAGSQFTDATNLRFALPPNTVGWIQIFGIYVLSGTALLDITFTLRINEAPVPGWNNIKPPPGVANFFAQNFSELQVRFPQGSVVDLLVTNNSAAGPWTVGGKIAGWYHPKSEELREWGDLP